MSYTTLLKGGAQLSIPAARFEADGSGHRFFSAEGALVASFADGQVTACYPSSVTPTTPADPAPAEEGEA